MASSWFGRLLLAGCFAALCAGLAGECAKGESGTTCADEADSEAMRQSLLQTRGIRESVRTGETSVPELLERKEALLAELARTEESLDTLHGDREKYYEDETEIISAEVDTVDVVDRPPKDPSDTMTYMDLTEIDDLARCNDNSPAGFYHSPPPEGSPASNTWVVYQEGGDWCYDRRTCRGRSRALTSGWGKPKYRGKFPTGSVLNAPGTSYEHAHKVYLPYCTSDGYIGNYTKDRIQFRGRVVTRAIFEALHTKYGLGAGAVVIHSGCSAGGRGVMHNVNFVGEQLLSYAEDIQYIPVIDSGLYVVPFNGRSKYKKAQGVYENTPESVDPKCKKVYPGEEWKCLIGEFAFPTLDAKFVTQAYLKDRFQVGYKSCKYMNKFCTWFRTHTHDLLLKYVEAGNAVFGPDIIQHCSIASEHFSRYTVDGESFASIVDSLASGGPPKSAIALGSAKTDTVELYTAEDACQVTMGSEAAANVTDGEVESPSNATAKGPKVAFKSGFTCTER